MQVFPHKHPQNPHKDTIILLSFLLFPPERSPDETGERPCPIRLRGRIPLPLFLLRCSLRSRLYDFFHFSLRFGQKERKGKGTCGGEKTKKPRGEPQSFRKWRLPTMFVARLLALSTPLPRPALSSKAGLIYRARCAAHVCVIVCVSSTTP